MADNEIKIKVTVDDSQEKKYYSEHESRRKKSTAQETEEEKRKTATLKAQLDEKYAYLKSSLAKEYEAIKQGNRLEIKEAIEKRKVLESELRKFEAENRASLRRQNFDYIEAQRKQAREQASLNTKFAKQQRLPEMGSLGFLGQLRSEQKRFAPGSQDYLNLGTVIAGTEASLKKANVEVRSLADQIGGNLNKSLAGASASFIQSTVSALGLTLGVQQLISFTTRAIQEFAKEEASMRSLEASVTRVTGQNVNLAKSLEDYSQELQRNYNINDDVIRQQLSFLVVQGRSEKQIKEITNAAIDLSAAQGDLSDENVIANINKLDATYEGVLGKLAKYDDRLKSLTPEQLKNGDAVRLLGQKYKGMADEIDKGSLESVRSVKVLWNTFLEFAGSVFAREGALLKGITTLNKNLQDGQGMWYSYSQAMREAAGTLPLIGGEMSALIGVMQNLLGITGELQTAIRDIKPPDFNLKTLRNGFTGSYEDAIRGLVNGYGLTWEQAREMIDKEFPSAKEMEAQNPSKTNPTKNSGSSNQVKKEIVEQLNLVKKLEEDLALAQKRLQANLGDIGAERQIRADILEIEKQIYRYRTGQINDTKFTMPDPVQELMRMNGLLTPKGIGRNPRALNDPRGDMSSEEFGNELAEIKEMANAMVSAFDQSLGFAQDILTQFGLADSEVANILNKLSSFLGTAMKGVSLIETISGLFGGGSLGGGSMGGLQYNPASYSYGSAPVLYANIHFKSDLEKDKLVRSVVRVTPEVNYQLNQKNVH